MGSSSLLNPASSARAKLRACHPAATADQALGRLRRGEPLAYTALAVRRPKDRAWRPCAPARHREKVAAHAATFRAIAKSRVTLVILFIPLMLGLLIFGNVRDVFNGMAAKDAVVRAGDRGHQLGGIQERLRLRQEGL